LHPMDIEDPEPATVSDAPNGRSQEAVRRMGAYMAAALLGGVFSLAVVFLVARWFGPGALPEVTAASFEVARATWQRTAPKNYDLDVVVTGRDTATYTVHVRDGVAQGAQRDGQSLPQQRTWGTWTVPGMFETIERDLEAVARHREGRAEPGTPQLLLRGVFDSQWGYPLRYQRTEVRKFGANQEVLWEVIRFEVVEGARDAY